MNVVILDTGCANLASVTYAVHRLGYDPVVSRDAEVVLRADKLFLPGVGTAQAAMDQLTARDLIPLIKACTQPVLGICLGMQLLGAASDENGGIDTLNIIPAAVKKCRIAACRYRTWAGIRSLPRPDTVCSKALMKVLTSTLCTAMPCRYVPTPSHKQSMVALLPPQYRRTTSTACNFTQNALGPLALSC